MGRLAVRGFVVVVVVCLSSACWGGGRVGGPPAGMATGGARMVRSRRDLAIPRTQKLPFKGFVKGFAKHTHLEAKEEMGDYSYGELSPIAYRQNTFAASFHRLGDCQRVLASWGLFAARSHGRTRFLMLSPQREARKSPDFWCSRAMFFLRGGGRTFQPPTRPRPSPSPPPHSYRQTPGVSYPPSTRKLT